MRIISGFFFFFFFFSFFLSFFLKIVNLGTENGRVHDDKHLGPKKWLKKVLKTRFGRISRRQLNKICLIFPENRI